MTLKPAGGVLVRGAYDDLAVHLGDNLRRLEPCHVLGFGEHGLQLAENRNPEVLRGGRVAAGVLGSKI